MRLRPRQKTFVERSVAALASRGNTLGVAPTGAGKTIMLSAVTGEMIANGARACVLAHRDELTAQNRAKFERVVPGASTSVIDAMEKSWGGQVAFAMVPTLARDSNLAEMPRLDLLVIDEAHHAVAESYRRIIDRVRSANPDARIFGVTATPSRGDRKGLREVFDNVADQVRLGELIASGHLVPPRTFVIDVGVQDELRSVRKTMSDFDMAEVADIMDRAPVTGEVIRHWKEKAGDRQTVVFCSTVDHARNVTEAFKATGVCAALIHGELASETRKAILADYAAGNTRVIVNVAVLTEGSRRYRYYVSMDLLKNREPPDDGIARRLPADTAEGAVIGEIRRLLRTPETIAQVISALGRDDISEVEALAALQRFPQLWEQLFPAEQARIIQLLVRRVTVMAEGLVIDLRTDGIAGVMRDLMTPRQLEAAE